MGAFPDSVSGLRRSSGTG